MADSQHFVLMLHPNRLQGFIWKAVLKSQQISVIWEAPDTNLKDNLIQLDQAGLTLPRLLIIDMQCLGENPYAFCRWCRDTYPSIKLLVTNYLQQDIAEPERNWAINQGASDLLPGFQQDNLVSSATTCVRRALKILDRNELNDGALISVLLKLRRELEARQAQQSNHAASMDGNTSMNAMGKDMNPALNSAAYAGQATTPFGMYAQQSPAAYGQNPAMGQTMPGQPMPMHPLPGQAMPMQPMSGNGNGAVMNGHYATGAMPMQPMNGQPTNGQYGGGAMPMQPMNGQMPAQYVNGYPVQNPMPGQPVPGQIAPGQQVPGANNGYGSQSAPSKQSSAKGNQSDNTGKQKFRRRYRGAWY